MMSHLDLRTGLWRFFMMTFSQIILPTIIIVSDLLTLIPTKLATQLDRAKNGTKVLIILFIAVILSIVKFSF